MNYLVAGDHTHFEYNKGKQTAWCTHGDWGGKVVFREDGTCKIEQVEYDSYTLTDCNSFESAVTDGLIDWE
jgi:hypothetical protein